MATTNRSRRRRAQPFLPTTMRAAALDHVGPASVLKVHDLPLPAIGARDVLIAVDTAGVGSWEPVQRSGEWGVDDAHFPLVLGSDGSGTVVAMNETDYGVSALVGSSFTMYAYSNAISFSRS